MPFVDRDGVRLHWRSDGHARNPALLLGNSLGTDLALWDPLVPALARHFRVLRFDKRGHGASDASPGAYTMELLGHDALAVADAANADRFSYIGISIGGMIGQWLGVNAGERIERLVLANTTARSSRETWNDRIEKVMAGGTASIADAVLQRWFTARFLARDDERLATARSTFAQCDRGGYAGCCAAIREMDFTASDARIAAPTLVLTGTHDLAAPKAQGEAIAAAIRDARLVELPYAHIPFVEAPGLFLQAVLPFLLGREIATERERYDAGLSRRKQALGAGYVESRLAQATRFNAEFQQLITRSVWGEIWTRFHLDDRTRRMLVIAITAALGRLEEFDLHARAGLDAELSADDLREVLLVVAMYAGVPAANTAFHRAARLVAEGEATTGV